MKQYLDLVKQVLEHWEEKWDRTWTWTISTFWVQNKYDLREWFPLVTTKKVRIDAILRELLWFLKWSTNINDWLTEFTPIWDAWADEKWELWPIYWYQWRKWEKFTKNKEWNYEKSHIDQITNVIERIKTKPDCRRLIVSAWNVANIDEMALPPCHSFFQFYVVNWRLDCQLYQRSADIALWVPYNIASYALLMTMVAQECNLTPWIFTHTMWDAHIYLNHIDWVKEQLTRTPKKLPKLTVAKKPFFDLEFEDFTLSDYEHDKFIKFEVSV